MKTKTNKGITLIALVITIIVLLILAGISIAMLTGENGILTQASKAKVEQNHAAVEEATVLAYGEYVIEPYAEEGEEKTFIDFLVEKEYMNETTGKIDVEKLVGEEQELGNGTGDTDVYKLEEEEGKYKLNYYGEDSSKLNLREFKGKTEGETGIVEPENVADWEYEPLEDGTLKLTGYKGSATEVVIPNSINGVPVTMISGNDIRKEIINLWHYTICDSDGTYQQNQKTITKVTISEGIEKIDSEAFQYSYNLKEIIIPTSVTSIGSSAFKGCTGLTSIEIPTSVTSIGGNAFYGCSSLTSIEIPSSVTSIGNYPFSECTSLTSIKVDQNNTKYDSRDNCNAIIETNTNKLILGCKNTVIPSSVTSIGSNAFYGYSSLTSIEIPESVTNIEDAAFSRCTGLTSIEIPSSVTNIGWGVFSGCSSLTSITIKKAEGSITGSPWGASADIIHWEPET